LIPIAKTLKDVTVITNKKFIEFKDDHLAFTPAADPTIGARPVVDILNRLPGIMVDERNQITAKGQDAVQLLVNGRMIRTAATDYLAQLNTDEVERIEIYDNATRFAYVKTPVVLNIILKQRKQTKLWNAGLNTSTLPKFNPSIDASIATGKQRFFGRLSHDVSVMRNLGWHARESENFDFLQEFNNRMQHTMSTARLGWDYSLDSLKTFSAELSFTRHNDKLNALTDVNNNGIVFKNNVESSPVENERAAWLSYKSDKKQKGYALFEFGITNFNLDNSRNIPALNLHEFRTMNNTAATGKMEWQKNLKKVKFINGVSGQVTHVTDEVDTAGQYQSTSNQYYTTSATTYHETSVTLKKWTVAVGATLDYLRLNLKKMGSPEYHFNDIFLNPSLRLTRSTTNLRTTLAYNRKTSLPGTHMLFGPYNQYEYDRIGLGNYALKPAVQDLLKLSFTRTGKPTMLLELYYDYTRSPFFTIFTVNNYRIIDIPQNLDSRSSIGSVISITQPVTPVYSFTVNLDTRLDNYEVSDSIFLLNRQTWSVFSSLVNRFTLNKKLSASFNISLHNWRTTLYRDIRPNIIYSLQGSYKISSRMNMSFSVNDISNDVRFAYSGKISSNFLEESYSKHKSRNVSLSFRYQLLNSDLLNRKQTAVKSFINE
jgi:hypothetical protein